MKKIVIVLCIALAGCVKDQSPYAGPPPTANQYYSQLDKSQRKLFGTGYVYGMTDAAGRYEQAEREAQRYDAYRAPKEAKLKTKIISLPVQGPFPDENGVWRSQDKRFIQIDSTQ